MSRQPVDADGFPLLPQSSSSASTIRLVSGQNQVQLAPPTEADGMVDVTRVKFHRQVTGGVAPAAAKPSNRRANSVSSLGQPSAIPFEDSLLEPIRNLNIVPVKHKVGSRHADVIDKWDGSGVGKSMWHHSGPYDAAAPSRNDIKKVGQTRAPMKAFRDVAGGVDAAASGTSSGMQSNVHLPASDVESAENPFADSSAALSMPPNNPEYDIGASLTDTSRPSERTHHKKHSSKHGGRLMSPRGEGLTGQYSTSLPASGGYFPPHTAGDAAVDNENHWELDERKRRQRERDQKHRALQAAWGIDEPEPFEEFGYSPRNEEPDNYKHPMSPDSTTPFAYAAQPQPVRSPSFKFGLNSKETSSTEYVVTTLGTSGEAYSPTSAQAGAGKAPLKRTRSLMQRLRAMRDSPNVPANAYPNDGQRSISPHSPYTEDTMGIKGPVPEGDESPRTTSSASTYQSATGASTKRRNSFLRRNPMRKNSINGVSPSKTPVDDFKSSEGRNEKEEILVTPGKEFPATPPVLTEAKGTPTPTKGILKNSAGYFPPSGTYAVSSDPNNYQPTSRARTEGRDKALPPPPPPPGPVMPDWNAPTEEDRTQNGYLQPNNGENPGGANVKRKTSMLKKMKDRITK